MLFHSVMHSTGDITVLFFKASTDMGDMTHDKHEVDSMMAMLGQSQRPPLVYCPGPSEDSIRRCKDSCRMQGRL